YMFSYREKAIALYDLGKYREALEVLKRAVTVQNNFDEGYYWMGKCYEKLGNKEDAIQSYQTALLYDKNFLEAREALNKLTGNGQ
ncbi:MAG TPA: tetratricopeptide repeat protein, partial [Ginsengibacter sp.]